MATTKWPNKKVIRSSNSSANFWGISAWMLELIMVLSAVLRKFPDLAVMGALLVVNAALSFIAVHFAGKS